MSDLTPALKVTKAQALANRTHIVETAFTRFRERGLDGEQVRARSLVILAQMVGPSSCRVPVPTIRRWPMTS